MRGEHDIGQCAQRMFGRQRLLLEHVERGARDPLYPEKLRERRVVHDLGPRRVHEVRLRLHPGEERP